MRIAVLADLHGHTEHLAAALPHITAADIVLAGRPEPQASPRARSAEASVDGATVVVWAEGVTRPAAVRFGWHQEAEPNLSNKEGLPASPFRTDDW